MATVTTTSSRCRSCASTGCPPPSFSPAASSTSPGCRGGTSSPGWPSGVLAARSSPASGSSGPLRLDGSRHLAAQELTRIYKSLPSERTEAFLDFCADAAGTGRCDGAGATELWMTWEMAAEMRDAGMTIGGHSATHPVLARARPEVQRQEISDNARRLGEELGIPMRFFAYPVGRRPPSTRPPVAPCAKPKSNWPSASTAATSGPGVSTPTTCRGRPSATG